MCCMEAPFRQRAVSKNRIILGGEEDSVIALRIDPCGGMGRVAESRAVVAQSSSKAYASALLAML